MIPYQKQQRRSGKSRDQEIADAVGLTQKTIHERTGELYNLDKCPKSIKLSAMFEDDSTQQEIADEVGLHKDTISERMKECRNLDKCPKSDKLSAMFSKTRPSYQRFKALPFFTGMNT